MIVIPAINAADSLAAAWTGGQPRTAPGAAARAAREFARCGFRRLHFDSGSDSQPWSDHASDLREILFDQQLDVQVHGGLADVDGIRDVFSHGARFAVIGGRALSDPDWLDEIASLFNGDIILNVRISHRRVRAVPWLGARSVDVFDLVDDIDTSQLAGFILTDLTRRRGTAGPDLALLEDLAASCECPVFAAGGVATMEQLRALSNRAVGGAVVGRAFAAGTLSPFAVAEEFGW